MMRGGSSPLARGLLRGYLGHAGYRRIIPARAGFTRGSRSPGSSTRDHPRSRGVYDSASWVIRCMRGSSPLARGLPAAAYWLLAQARIIPARAGFTKVLRATAGRLGDHPRSRGVYGLKISPVGRRPGSSPLARGLPAPCIPGCRPPRIIPARAGFTPEQTLVVNRSTDHPRSRGVYVRTDDGRKRNWGSSPLARGLPHCSSR